MRLTVLDRPPVSVPEAGPVLVLRYDDVIRAEARAEDVYRALEDLTERPTYDPDDVDLAALHDVSAEALAGRLAGVLDRVSGRSARAGVGPASAVAGGAVR